MRKHRILLLGVGFFGRNWIQVIAADNDCELIAATGTAEEFKALRAQGFQLDIPTYTDYKEAIEKTPADIVVIVIPTLFHTDAAARAMERGMNVLSEKPLTFNREDALRILSIKSSYPARQYVIDQNYRWRPHNVTVKRLLDGGIVGKLRAISCEFRRSEDLIGYRVDLEMPLLQDVCIHHFDLIRYFSGKNCMRAFARSYHLPWSKFRGQASSDILLEMEDGLYVNYAGTWSGRGKATTWDGTFTFMGDMGCLVLDEDSKISFFAADGSKPAAYAAEPIEHEELAQCLHQLKRAIAGKRPAETSLEDNIHSYLMVCAAEKSAFEGRWVECQ